MKDNLLQTHDIAKKVTEACKGETDKRLTIEDTKVILRTLGAVIGEELISGNIVRLHGFADFYPVVAPAGEAIDPRTSEKIAVPERMLAKVKLSRSFKTAVKETWAERNA